MGVGKRNSAVAERISLCLDDFSVVEKTLPAVGDSQRAHDPSAVEHGRNDRALHACRFGPRSHVAARVGLYIAGVNGLSAFDRETCHSFADRNFF